MTPSNVSNEKEKMMNEINKYKKVIDDGKIKLPEKEIINANNMLEYFKK